MVFVEQNGLVAHAECWKFKEEHPEEWESFGCGPGGFGDILVPDTMWGLCVTEACRIHDWYYRFFVDRSAKAKQLADDLLQSNALVIIDRESKYWITRNLRHVRANTYHFMVSKFGQSSWDDCKSIRDK